MNIDIDTTYEIAAKDVEPGMVLKTIGNIPLEVESVDRRDPAKIEVFFKTPENISPRENYQTSSIVHPEYVYTRYHEND